MSLDARELVAALPIDVDEPQETTQQALEQLLGKLSHMPVPVSRLTRLWTLGSMQAKIAVAYLAYWIRSGYAARDEKERLLNETHLKAALKLLGGMGYLRGAIMKVGQVIANYPDVAPQEFVDVLGRLQFQAPPMHFSLLREFVRGELGHDPEELFDDFETTAFAAASLGQVHRARLKDSGRRVAVKIQYPNIGRTIRDDFRTMKAVALPMRLTSAWDNLLEQGEDIQRMLDLETDYEQEADNLRTARRLFTEDEGIVVPEVISELSTKRVLTMEYIEGVHLDAFLESSPSQALRDEFGRKIVRSCFRVEYAGRMVYADPHPGNYFFMADGRLGLIDFGCCRHVSQEEMEYVEECERAFYTSRQAVRDAMVRGMDFSSADDVSSDQVDLCVRWADWSWEPLLKQGPFDFGDPDYFSRGIKIFAKLLKKRYTHSKPINTWLTRSVYGLRAILARLEACFDFGEVYRAESRVKPPRR